MFDKYSNILTMILIFFVVAICGIIGYFAYDLFNSNNINSNAQSAIDEFESATQTVKNNKEKNTVVENKVVENKVVKNDIKLETKAEEIKDKVEDEDTKINFKRK